MFEQAYHSVYHHPLVTWAAGAVVLAVLLASRVPRRGFLGVALLVFELEIMLDAWLTGGLKPFADDATIATVTALTFVVLGDLRYFVLLERYGREDGVRPTRWLLYPLVYALVVPLASSVARWLWPGNFRALFLTYELMFAALALGIRFAVLPRREARCSAPRQRFLVRLTHFEIAQYLLWASADVVILLGVDAGYLLRLIPNLMYYVAFVPFAWWAGGEELAPAVRPDAS